MNLRPLLVLALLGLAACDGPTGPRMPFYEEAALAHFETLASPPPVMSGGLPLVQASLVRKWRGAIRVASAGQPWPEDLAILAGAVDEIRRATGHTIEIVSGTSTPPNVVVHFLPRAEAMALEPELQLYQIGFFRTSLSDYQIVAARIVIVVDEIAPATRPYIVRHELMHVLGFPNHTGQVPESVLHQPWAGASGFSDLDLTIMEMMYRSEIAPGMPVDEAVDVLGRGSAR